MSRKVIYCCSARGPLFLFVFVWGSLAAAVENLKNCNCAWFTVWRSKLSGYEWQVSRYWILTTYHRLLVVFLCLIMCYRLHRTIIQQLQNSKTSRILLGVVLSVTKLRSSFKHATHNLHILFDNYINLRLQKCIINHHKYSIVYIRTTQLYFTETCNILIWQVVNNWATVHTLFRI